MLFPNDSALVMNGLLMIAGQSFRKGSNIRQQLFCDTSMRFIFNTVLLPGNRPWSPMGEGRASAASLRNAFQIWFSHKGRQERRLSR
jgi:hypothetical protein